ncbi:hotdog family protein [Oceanicoccus sp. KOV_DT_Chl]|uniref:ApeP family dehydratase n=1 Tax=Oceanicoccus sp. KOV_DT_Chl TaxID=1904639 RepID=UPI000C795FF4|nr:hotdog family protein [Oceanicoccus sp. KOV_DT_Chl]
MNNTVSQYTVDELVPHSGHMSLLDRVINQTAERLIAEVDITAHSLFLDGDIGVPTWVGIEYMAQAVAAWAGVIARQAGEDVRLGFLLGSRKYTAHASHFGLGETLTVTVERAYQHDELGVFDCSIYLNGDAEVASARLNVYQPQ